MKKFLLSVITFYQHIISPLLHQLLGVQAGCRQHPTCSVYAKQAIKNNGVVKGSLLSLRRVLTCQPYFNL